MEYFFGPLIGNFLCLDPGFFFFELMTVDSVMDANI